MPMSQALRLCPGLQIIPGDHAAYGQASSRVMEILGGLTPLLEQVSIDEAFLDVTDLPETAEQIARQLQAQILRETGLPCSLGVAANKLVAKLANDYGKAAARGLVPPQAITVVSPGQEEAFLQPLPVGMLWGVGKKTELRLQGLGIQTIADLLKIPPAELVQVFGKNGADLLQRARGIDNRLVETEREVKSISQETTFDRDVTDPRRLKETLREQSAQVAFRLRKSEFCAKTVRLKLRWADFTTLTRQVSLAEVVDQDTIIFKASLELFNSVWQTGRKVRLIGVGVSGLVKPTLQPGLWEQSSDKERRLLEAVDGLREKFGSKAIQAGRRISPAARSKIKNKPE
jgi:DNA polymerase-4